MQGSHEGRGSRKVQRSFACIQEVIKEMRVGQGGNTEEAIPVSWGSMGEVGDFS